MLQIARKTILTKTTKTTTYTIIYGDLHSRFEIKCKCENALQL